MVENEHNSSPEDEIPQEPKQEQLGEQEEELPQYQKDERALKRLVIELNPEADRLIREQLEEPIKIPSLEPEEIEPAEEAQLPDQKAPSPAPKKEKRGLDLRERGLLWQLKRRKVEHPKEALEAIRALEAHFKVSEMQHFTVSKDSYSDFLERWEKKGYRVSVAYSQEKVPSGKVRVDVVRDRPFRMDAWNMSWLVRMCKTVPNPADYLISLNKIGVIHGLYKNEIEDGKNFISAFESKKTRALVSTLAQSGVEINDRSGNRVATIIGGGEAALEALHAAAEKREKDDFTNQERQALVQLARIVPPTPAELETFLVLPDHPEAISYLAELKKQEEGGNYNRFDRVGLLRSAQLLCELKVAGALARLFSEGVKLRKDFLKEGIIDWLRNKSEGSDAYAFEAAIALKNFLRGKSLQELKESDVYDRLHSEYDFERVTKYSAVLGRIPSRAEMWAFEG